jgi:hypothetical protein
MIYPLTERAGYSQIMDLAKAAQLRTSEKFLQKLSSLAEAEDALMLVARKAPDTGGCANRLRERGLIALASFVIAAIEAAPEDLLNIQIVALRNLAEKDLEAVAEGQRRKEAAERSALEARWAAEEISVGAMLAEIETGTARLALVDDQIVLHGASLSDRQRVILRQPRMRRDLILALQGREHQEVV